MAEKAWKPDEVKGRMPGNFRTNVPIPNAREFSPRTFLVWNPRRHLQLPIQIMILG